MNLYKITLSQGFEILTDAATFADAVQKTEVFLGDNGDNKKILAVALVGTEITVTGGDVVPGFYNIMKG